MPHADRRIVRWFAAAGVAWALAATAFAALRLNFERAPVVHVRWAPSVNNEERVSLQRQFALSGEQYDSGQTWRYFLTSTSTENIKAIVQSPAVDDTHHLDRVEFRVSPSAPRSGPYMTTGARWLPQALHATSVVFALAGLLALAVATAPAVNQTLSTIHGGRGVPLTLYVLCVGLVAISPFYFSELRHGAEQSEPFRVGDWLVGYGTGFVRRGLLGSPILWLTKVSLLPPQTVVFWLQAGLYLLFFFLLFLLVRRNRPNIWFLVFLFSPAGLLFPLYDRAVVGRKDVLFYAAFALYAWWMPAPDSRPARFASFALGAATTLAHELFFFFTPYFFLMRSLREKDAPGPRRFAPEIWLFGGALVALLIASTVGADMHGEAQCADLLRRGVNGQLCEGILRYPATTIGESMQEVAARWRPDGYVPAYPIAAVLSMLPLVLVLHAGQPLRRMFILGGLAAFTFSLPMFAIALDWGRLLNIHVIALAIALAAFVPDDRKDHRFADGGRVWWRRAAVVCGVVLYMTTWSIRHCCEHPLKAGIFHAD